MKILDRYVAKNFLVGYAIAFGVLIGLRIIIDLFVGLDEFTEHADRGTLKVLADIGTYYALQTTLYFRDFAGMITVVAAAFSLSRMVRLNELVAVMASGVSLKRLIVPIVFLAVLLTGVLVIDQELVIPPLADRLVLDKDDIAGLESYDVWFLADGRGSLICSAQFDVESSTLIDPTIITRSRIGNSARWEVTSWISAAKAVYNRSTGKWDLLGGRRIEKAPGRGIAEVASYDSGDLRPRDIPVRRKSTHKTLLSSRQLAALAAQHTKIKDLAQLYSEKHFRVTDPIINLVMLLISLPVLVCRDPKSMKSSIVISFGLTAACFVTTFVCKILATEVIFYRVMPELWAWLAVFIFFPIAFIEIDSMKT